MPRSNSSFAKASLRSSKIAYRHADKAFTRFAKWATTDHTGFSQSLLGMPSLGFRDTLRFLVIRFLIGMAGALLSGLVVFLMIAYGIPFLIDLILF